MQSQIQIQASCPWGRDLCLPLPPPRLRPARLLECCRRLKIDHKFRSKFRLVVLSIFGSFWDAFLLPFCCFFAPGALLDTHLHQKSQCSRKTLKTTGKSMFFVPRRPSKTTLNRSKSLPKGSFFHLEIAPRFWIDFFPIFGAKMPPFWHLKPTLKFIKIVLNNKLAPRVPQDRPRAAQEPPQTAPRPLPEPQIGENGSPKPSREGVKECFLHMFSIVASN